MRRAFFVRATRLADPDFVDVPIDELTSEAFADELAATIGPEATPSAALADFPIVGLAEGAAHDPPVGRRRRAGNAVALTYTLEQGYGSKAVVPGAGFLLNNEMGDFNLVPGRTDASGLIGTAPNRIAPGKRMLSSMSPTIVMRGRPRPRSSPARRAAGRSRTRCSGSCSTSWSSADRPARRSTPRGRITPGSPTS